MVSVAMDNNDFLLRLQEQYEQAKDMANKAAVEARAIAELLKLRGVQVDGETDSVIAKVFGKQPPRSVGRPPKGSLSMADAVRTVLRNGPKEGLPFSKIREAVSHMGVVSDSKHPDKVLWQAMDKMQDVVYTKISHLYQLRGNDE